MAPSLLDVAQRNNNNHAIALWTRRRLRCTRAVQCPSMSSPSAAVHVDVVSFGRNARRCCLLRPLYPSTSIGSSTPRCSASPDRCAIAPGYHATGPTLLLELSPAHILHPRLHRRLRGRLVLCFNSSVLHPTLLRLPSSVLRPTLLQCRCARSAALATPPQLPSLSPGIGLSSASLGLLDADSSFSASSRRIHRRWPLSRCCAWPSGSFALWSWLLFGKERRGIWLVVESERGEGEGAM